MPRSNMVVLFNSHVEDEVKQEQFWQMWVQYENQLRLSPSTCDIIYDLWIKGEIGIWVEY